MQTLVSRVMELARLCPQKSALVLKKDTLCYEKLCSKMTGIAKILAELGIQKGDRVLFRAVSKPEMAAVYLGIQCCGAVAVFADKAGSPEYIAQVYQEAGAALLLTDLPMKACAGTCRVYSLKKIYQNAPELCGAYSYDVPGEEETAEILFTTGTTGKPKGVILSYRALFHIWSNTIKGVGMREDDRVLLPLPLHHSAGLRILRAVLYRGATVVLQNGFLFAKEIEYNVDRHHCTAMAAVPASIETVRMQMQDRFAGIIGKLRYVEACAGALTLRQRKELVSLLPDTVIYNTWGSSETGGALFLNVSKAAKDPVSDRILSLGKPLPDIEAAVLDEAGQPLASSREHPGRLALKGGMQMSGYWNEPQLTKQALRDGWLITGDLVFMDKDGYVYMAGRADDMINVGGEKVFPAEVEHAASLYEGVRECACIGVEDPKGILGQVPVLFVVPQDGAFTQAGLHKYLSERIGHLKLPQEYVLLAQLPKAGLHKTDKKALRRLWEAQDAFELMNPVIQAILTRRSVRHFIKKQIPGQVLDLILKAGYHAPTGHNMQSWKFTVLENSSNIERLKEAAQAASQRCGVYFYGFEYPAAVILVSNDSRNGNGCQDASCAAENIFLAAASYGIGSVWLNALKGLRQEEPVKSLLDEFGVPSNHIVWCMAALGYPAAQGSSPKRREDVVCFVDRGTGRTSDTSAKTDQDKI